MSSWELKQYFFMQNLPDWSPQIADQIVQEVG